MTWRIRDLQIRQIPRQTNFFVARWTCFRGRENEGVAPSPRLFLSFQLGKERQNPHWETFLLKIAHSHVKMGQKFCAQGRAVGINATGEKVWSGGRSIFFFSSFLAGTIEGNFQSNFVAAYCWFFPYFSCKHLPSNLNNKCRFFCSKALSLPFVFFGNILEVILLTWRCWKCW